jgi:hypothetical protein
VIGGSGVYNVTPSSGTIPPGLSIDPVTGVLAGTPTRAGDYRFTVQANDIDAGSAISGEFHIVIVGAVAITTNTLSEGFIGQAYDATIGVSGGVAAYQWTVTGVGGGLSVADNAISGTPTAAGTYDVTATVTDQLGSSATKTFTLVIHCPAPVTTATFSCQTVTLSATDQGCGLTTSYRVDGGAVQNYAGPFTLAGGAHTVDYWSADTTGTQEASKPLQVPAPTSAPALTSLSPNTATAGSAALTLTVTGNSFEANSVVQWNGALRPTTFVSATQLTASIAATDLTTAGTAQVSVTTASTCGGGISTTLPFTISTAGGGGGNQVEAEAQGTPVSPQLLTGTFTLFPLTETSGFFSEGKPLAVVTTPKTVFLDTKGKVITKAQFFNLLAQAKKVEVEGTFAKVPSAGGVLVNTLTRLLCFAQMRGTVT